MPDVSKNTGIGADLRELLQVIESVAIPTDSDLRPRRDSLSRTIRDSLLPRVDNPGRPLRVVFAGPTGSGKSTMINGVVGRNVTPSGSMRPTTRLPLVYTKPSLAGDFVGYKVVTGKAPILDDMCLIDTPDIDSTSRENHRLARTVLEAADVVVFVSSALRYADLVPWRVLRDLEERGIPVIHALNRISTSSAGVVTDYRRMLRREGMHGPVIRVEEHRLRPRGQVPGASLRNLRRQLLETVRVRKSESDSILEATIADLCDRAEAFLTEVDGMSNAARALAASTATQLADIRSMGVAESLHHWSNLLHVDEDRWVVSRGWLRRRGLNVEALDRISTQIRAALVAALEEGIRPLSIEEGRLVVDLRSSARGQSQALMSIIDRGINRWYDSIAPPMDLSPDAFSYHRARRALADLEYVVATERLEPSPSALLLERAVGEIGQRIASKVLVDLEPELDLTAGRTVLERITRAPVLADA